jgi:hypothetical protein
VEEGDRGREEGGGRREEEGGGRREEGGRFKMGLGIPSFRS